MTDVIILSSAKSSDLYYMAQRTISSCYYKAGSQLNILVIEQNPEVPDYELCKTIRNATSFNYNAFANIGASYGVGENIVIANNDLEFTEGWLAELIRTNHALVSPRCPKDMRQRDVTEDEVGEKVGRNLSGWCFMIKRSLWKKIGGFDEAVSFWCSDNALVEQCKKEGVLPMLVYSSVVRHIGSQTLKTMENREELTHKQVRVYNKKYNKNLFNMGKEC